MDVHTDGLRGSGNRRARQETKTAPISAQPFVACGMDAVVLESPVLQQDDRR